MWKSPLFSRISSFFLLFSFFWIVASASFSGFVGKWGLRDGQADLGIEAMLDATGAKPFVYRQLAPITANYLNSHLSRKIKDFVVWRLVPELTFSKVNIKNNPEIRFRYTYILFLTFFSTFLSLFILKLILLELGVTDINATFAPAAFILTFPYLQTVGGYFYDSIELLFFSLTFWFALRGKILPLVLLTVPATLNKETFIFFLPTLYPLLREKLSGTLSVLLVGISCVVSGVINVLVKFFFKDSRGGAAEFHLWENIQSYFDLSTYWQIEHTYGLTGPAGASFLTIILISAVVIKGWTEFPLFLRHHLLLAAGINFPLFIFFCATGELRNLSLLFVVFVILIAFMLKDSGKRYDKLA